MKFKLTSFKVVGGDDAETIYHTSNQNKLFDWVEEICAQGRPTSIEDAIEMVEYSKLYLITK